MKKLLSILLAVCLVVPASAAKKRKHITKAKAESEVVHLTGENTVLLAEVITGPMVDNMISAMILKRSSLPMKETMYILINSGGGEVYSALNLRQAILQMPNTQVICSYCGSAAAMIFVSSGEKRLVTDQSSILMHEMFISHMTAEMFTDIRGIADFIRLSDAFDRLFYTMIGISREEYMRHIQNQVWVIDGADIVAHHLADKTIKVDCAQEIKDMESNVCQ